MKKFNILYESVLKSLIKEGGNAVPNVDRIEKRNINSTINDFKKKILIPFLGSDPGEDLFTLGSTGKKPDSGDIDLAITQSILPFYPLVSLIKLNEACAKMGVVSCINTINYKMLHIAYPQKNVDKNVQIDLLITDYPEFTKFFMYSPAPNDSKYKGAHRNELLHAIAKLISYKGLQSNRAGEIVKWVQDDVSDDGYYHVVKTLIDDEGNRLKYKSTNEDLEEQYALEEEKNDITHDPSEVVKLLFGDEFEISDIDTFEKCFHIIKSDERFKYKEISNQILREAAKSLKEKRKRLVFPIELKGYFVK